MYLSWEINYFRESIKKDKSMQLIKSFSTWFTKDQHILFLYLSLRNILEFKGVPGTPQVQNPCS